MSRQYDDMVDSIKSACCEENEIPGYEGYYATPDGEIVNDERVIKPHKGDKQGHLNVRICGKEPYIHRLVATTHIPNPKNHPIVRHLNDDKTDNSVDNLAWGTQKDNMGDCKRNGNFHYVSEAEREKGLEKRRRPVYAEKDGIRTEYKSISDAKRSTGAVNADKVLSGEREKACGYTFGYIDE